MWESRKVLEQNDPGKKLFSSRSNDFHFLRITYSETFKSITTQKPSNHFPGKEAQGQRDGVTFPGSHIWSVPFTWEWTYNIQSEGGRSRRYSFCSSHVSLRLARIGLGMQPSGRELAYHVQCSGFKRQYWKKERKKKRQAQF